MAKPKVERGKLVESIAEFKNKCLVCNVEYLATKMTYQNGDIIITPPRCPECQTIHLTNLRVNNTCKQISLIGNLKTRLTVEQRAAVIEELTNALNTVYERFQGTATAMTGFDLKKV